MQIQSTLDKYSIGLSSLCLAHCLLLPAVAILLPTLLAVPLEDEIFHKVLVVCVLPLSSVALILGCQKHRTWFVLAWGATGLSVLFFAAIFGHDLFGETAEKVLTVIGSLLMIVSHYKNYRLCNKHNHCEC